MVEVVVVVVFLLVNIVVSGFKYTLFGKSESINGEYSGWKRAPSVRLM